MFVLDFHVSVSCRYAVFGAHTLLPKVLVDAYDPDGNVPAALWSRLYMCNISVLERG